MAVRHADRDQRGEGDFVYLPGALGGVVLAGHGFRTEAAAHSEAQEALGRPVVSLRLIDPRFYTSTWRWPRSTTRTSPTSPGVLRLHAGGAAATVPGRGARRRGGRARVRVNLVSDGRNVVLNTEATALAAKLRVAGYLPVPVELTELKKGGGSVSAASPNCAPEACAPGVTRLRGHSCLHDEWTRTTWAV